MKMSGEKFKNNKISPGCRAWSRQDDIHPLNCNISLSAVCVRDMADLIIFPDPESEIELFHGAGDNTVHVSRMNNNRKRNPSKGWRTNYSLHAWHRDNNSRRFIVIIINEFFLNMFDRVNISKCLKVT